MKAILYMGQPNRVSYEEVSTPEILDNEALIKVNYAGICGADIELITGKRKVDTAVIPGHEIVGTVIELKGGDKTFIGKRVAVEPTISCGTCQMCIRGLPHLCYNLKVLGFHVHGGMAEYVKVIANKLHLIPDGVAGQNAAVTEPVAVAVHVTRRSQLKFGESVLIIGAGPIGILIAQVCRSVGAKEIVIVDLNPFRLEICKELGFEVMDSSYVKKSEERGFDIGFEVSGTNPGMDQILKNIRARGRIVVVGFFNQTFPIDFSDLLFRELEIKGSRVYSHDDFNTAIDLIHKEKVNVASIITDVLPLKEFSKGFELAAKREAMKVVVNVE